MTGKKTAVPAALALLAALALPLPLEAQNEALPLTVPRPNEAGTDIYPESYEGDINDRALDKSFSGLYSSALVGRYLDEAPAVRRAGELRARGIQAFVLKKQVRESRFLKSNPVGDFYMVMAGVFSAKQDADNLGQRLRAEGVVRDYRILPVDDPGEIKSTDLQNTELYAQSGELSRQIKERAAKPLEPDSPVVTGEAFKKHVRGRYVGSFKDPLAAREEARRLSQGGWSASVESQGGWYRVYLAPTEDTRDFKADPARLKSARSSAESQIGLFFVVDLSRLRGSIEPTSPNAGRTDASACAGFSEAGRLVTAVRRAMIYIPESSYTVALSPVEPPAKMDWRDIAAKIQKWWDDEKTRPSRRAIYGPAIFNRPEMEKALSRMQPSERPGSLALGLTEAAIDFDSASGRKILLVFSEFKSKEKEEDIRQALSRLKSAYGGLDPIFIYGDTDKAGYELAQNLAKENAGDEAWDSCRLLADNAYFERFIKRIFK